MPEARISDAMHNVVTTLVQNWETTKDLFGLDLATTLYGMPVSRRYSKRFARRSSCRGRAPIVLSTRIPLSTCPTHALLSLAPPPPWRTAFHSLAVRAALAAAAACASHNAAGIKV